MTTSTCSASATGLPDRRRLLSAFAAASALGLPAAAAIAGPTSHPDAELIALAAQIEAAEELCHELGHRSDELFETYVDPPIPETLFWRPSDFPSVWVDRDGLDTIGPEGKDRSTYACDDVLRKLRIRLALWRAAPNASFSDRDLARVEQIVGDLEAWEAARQCKLDAGGHTAASEAHHRQWMHVEALRRRLAVTPARSAEGVRIKVWAAHESGMRGTRLQQELDDLLELPELRFDQPREMLLISAMIDAEKLPLPKAVSVGGTA